MRPVGAKTNNPKSKASIACWSTPPTSGPPHRRAGLASHATPSTSLFLHCPPTQSRACSTITPPYQLCPLHRILTNHLQLCRSPILLQLPKTLLLSNHLRFLSTYKIGRIFIMINHDKLV